MLDYEKNWVRLPLQNAHNVREIGGYPVKDGGQIAYHRFLRSDDLSTLSEADIEFLVAYGVNLVIDLRSDDEAQKAPDRLEGVEGVEYVRLPYLGKDLTDATKVNPEELDIGLGAMYVGMIENKEMTKKIFEAIERAPKGCVLFHCAVGKDRTGIVAMLLMSLAGADKQDCVTNYAQSFINLSRRVELMEMFKKVANTKFEAMMYSHPETISGCYDLMMEKYGSTKNYLKECGLKEEQIQNIKKRLLEA